MVNMRIKVLKLSIVYVVFESVKKNNLDCNAEIIKLRLSDAEEAECEAGVQLGEGQPAGVRHVVAGVHPLAGGLRGVRVQVEHLLLHTPQQIQRVVRGAA